MGDINLELIQFFLEQNNQYTFLLHRTKDEQSALSILEYGLVFEENIHKVTDLVNKDVVNSLLANKIFLRPYGEFIVLIAIPKSMSIKNGEFIKPLDKIEFDNLKDKVDMSEIELPYHLAPKYILGYNKSFSKKIKYNKKFGFYANHLPATA